MEQTRVRVTSDFNEAAMQMQRLHNIWLNCGTSKEQGNIQRYENFLRNAETELKYDSNLLSDGLDEKHESNYTFKLKQFNIKINKCNELVSRSIGIYEQAAINKKWSLLIEKEEFLREIQEESGKGGKRSNPDEEDELD